MCGFASFAIGRADQFSKLFRRCNNFTMFYEALVIFSVSAMATSDVSEYFPNPKDMTKVTWAHAVNNQTLLNSALSSNVHMLEADVALGKLIDDDTSEIPIMAHPPNTISDLSLKDFLLQVNTHNNNNTKLHKGVKLDFKSIEAYQASVDVLRENIKDLKPVWLNADILRGPVNATTTPVDPKQFITSSKEFKNIVLSLGWTTNYNTSLEGNSYTEEHIDEMIKTINSLDVNQTVTFPVRAGLAAESLKEMKTLVTNISDSTLTIWSSENDPVNVKHLKTLITDIGLDKVYVDVPKKLRDQLGLPSSGSRLAHFGIFSIVCYFLTLYCKI